MLHVTSILRALIYFKNSATIILGGIFLFCYCQNKSEVVKLALVYSLSRIIWLWILGIQNDQNLFFLF